MDTAAEALPPGGLANLRCDDDLGSVPAGTGARFGTRELVMPVSAYIQAALFIMSRRESPCSPRPAPSKSSASGSRARFSQT